MAEARWYVIHTYAGYENKVASNLEKLVENRKMADLIHEIRVPTETVIDPKDNKEKVRKTFPGYVMVKMIVTDDSWYVVRNVRGCTGFVGPASKPVPLTDDEVRRMGVETTSIELSYGVGDSVKIVDGPLTGFTGIVDEVDLTNNQVKITISMFGRETPVELELDQVEPEQ